MTDARTIHDFSTVLTAAGSSLLDLNHLQVKASLVTRNFVMLRDRSDGVEQFESFTDKFGRVRAANLRPRAKRPSESDRGS